MGDGAWGNPRKGQGGSHEGNGGENFRASVCVPSPPALDFGGLGAGVGAVAASTAKEASSYPPPKANCRRGSPVNFRPRLFFWSSLQISVKFTVWR